MFNLRFALIGKNISHSLSPQLYRELISNNIKYDLIDIDNISKLPTLDFLNSNYTGINITAPWKDAYFAYAIPEARKWLAVNCIRFLNGVPEATNTDATALLELIPELIKKNDPEMWIILGDGAMAKVISIILAELGHNFRIHSRRLGDQLNQLNFVSEYKKFSKKILINTCAREFIFTNNLDATWLFWDLNYSHARHQEAFSKQDSDYIDGFDLLKTQARHAVKFWNL
jgi:shikimate dehydrogenase